MEVLLAPRFPVEIECMIFEMATRSTKGTTLGSVNLILVAKRTQLWVERIVYDTLTYAYSSISEMPQPCGLHVPYSKFHLVRQLSLSGLETVPVLFTHSKLLACCNITTLEMWFDSHADFVFNFILEGNLPLLKRLSIRPRKISSEAFNGPDAPGRLQTLHLTHLEFLDPSLGVKMYSFLNHIPNLTHLGFFSPGGSTPPKVFDYILSSPFASRLKVILATKCHVENYMPRRERPEKYKESGIDDVRFVYLSRFEPVFMEDQSRPVEDTHVGIWEFAEEIIEERKRKIKEAGGDI